MQRGRNNQTILGLENFLYNKESADLKSIYSYKKETKYLPGIMIIQSVYQVKTN